MARQKRITYKLRRKLARVSELVIDDYTLTDDMIAYLEGRNWHRSTQKALESRGLVENGKLSREGEEVIGVIRLAKRYKID